jgi:hypothetical protein
MATPTEKRHLRVKRALANPVFFAETYYRPYDQSWAADMPVFAQEMLRFIRLTQRGVVMLPPEFMKTTICSQVYPLWLTYRSAVMGKMLRGMLSSEEEGLAAANLGVIAWHIENNEFLARDFIDAKGKRMVFPDSKGVQGRRIDVLIADDLVTPKNSMSPTLRKRALDFWDLQFETRLVASGQAVVCGNFNDIRDLLSTLANRPGYQSFRRPSLHSAANPAEPPREQDLNDPERAILTWPEVWTRPRLMQERKAKPQRFRRIHLLDSRAEMGEQLKVEWMQVVQPEETPLKYARYYIGLDPAPGSSGDDADYFNITVGALHGSNLDVVEIRDLRADIPRQVELVGLMHDRYQRLGMGVVAIGCARITLDRYFRGALTVARKDLGHKIVEVSVAGAKEERLEGLGPYAQSGFLRVWESMWLGLMSDATDQWQELSLYEQWRDFPQARHDDKLDGLDVMIRTAREFANVGTVDYELEVLEAT